MIKFLIIDDQTEQTYFFSTFLRKEFPGSIILSAVSGKEGIEIAERELPDLILLDLSMPEMDGIETLKLLKQKESTKNIPVIITTATIKDDEARINSIIAGADYFILRPENIDELAPQITYLLRRKGHTVEFGKSEDLSVSKDRENALREALNEIQIAHKKIKEQNKALEKEIKEKNILLESLKASEKRFKILFDSGFDLIFILEITDNGIKINDVNEIAEQKLGYSKKEILHLEFSKLYSTEKEELLKFILKANLGRTSKGKFEHLAKDGSVIKVEAKVKLLEFQDKKLVYLQERDITEESKIINKLKMLSTIIEVSPISVIITDINGRTEYVNQNFLDTSGFTEDEIIGTVPPVLSIDYYNDEDYRKLWNILKGGDVWLGEFSNMTKEGKRFWELVAISPISDQDGVIRNFAIIAQDITEQKNLIEKLKIAKAEAEKSDQLKSEFLARISHEIRTPLNTIVNFSQVLFEELQGEENEIIQVSREAITEASKRIARTIELILDSAQIETGNLEYKEEEFDIVKDCLKSIINDYSYKAKKKNIKLNLSVDSTDTKLRADWYTVFQIFSNLIDNAIKFTVEGEVNVKVFRNNENKLTVTVEDTGIGISEDFLPELFKPFTQEEIGYSRRFEGTGLGMSLVKKYCDLNNAEIKVWSKKGIGTKVTITFKNIN